MDILNLTVLINIHSKNYKKDRSRLEKYTAKIQMIRYVTLN